MNLNDFYFVFLNLVFGILFFVRTIAFICKSYGIFSFYWTPILIFISILTCFVFNRGDLDVISLWFCVTGPILVSILLAELIYRHKFKKFKLEFLCFLERTIAYMRSGSGFRESLEAATPECDAFTQQMLKQIFHSVFFAQQEHNAAFIIAPAKRICLI